MLCENCNMKEATVYYTEIINDHSNKRRLCQECASLAGVIPPNISSSFFASDLNLGNLLTTILGGPSLYTGTKPYAGSDISCQNCGMAYQDFLQKGKFGCSKCFDSYGRVLDESLKRIHGSDRHIGKRPINYKGSSLNNTDNTGDIFNESTHEYNKIGKKPEIDKLQDQLSEAVRKEEYEEAARLRDIIRELKAGEGEDE